MVRMLVSIAVVTLGTMFLVAVSRHSLAHPRSHGFSRFFAFEAILCLVVLNLPHWFERPLAPKQIASWTLLTAALFLAIHGFHLLRVLGRPSAPPPGSPTYRFENTATLVTIGAYRYIRHPMYSSLLLLAWGAGFKDLSVPAVVLGLVATMFLLRTAKTEEEENITRFGDGYREYMRRTRLFVPFVW